MPTLIFILFPSRLSLLAITSLALTAHTAYFLPLRQGILPTNLDDGPLRFIPLLNGVLAGVVLLDGFVRSKSSEMFWISTLPGIMWCAIWVGRSWATSIDLEGLEKLKYNVSTSINVSNGSIKGHNFTASYTPEILFNR